MTWIEKELGDLVTLNYGKSLPERSRVFGNVPVYGSNGLVGYHNEPIITMPGIIVGRKGSAGEIHYSSQPFCPIDTTFYITQNDINGLDLRFCYFALKKINLKRILGDVGVPGLNREMAYKELLLYPVDISEQRKIAAVLSTLQKAIETQTKLIEKTTELKKAMMHKLFTEGTRGEKQKMTDIGLVPESWEVVELGSIPVKMFGGGTPSTNIKEYWNGDIEWTTSKRLEEGKIFISKGEKKITLSGLNDSSSKLVPKNSLIISTRVTVGKVAINKIDLAISQDLTGLIIDSSRFSLEFIAFQILTDRVQKIFDSRKRGATIKGITREDLKSIRILLPPIHEQHDISNCLLSIDRKIDHHIAKKQKLEELFRTLLHQLMTAEIRVNDIDLDFLEEGNNAHPNRT